MTKNISEEELLLRKRARRRLVGAIVLVIFAIIVLPLIFDDPKIDNEPHEIAINLPPSGKDGYASTAPAMEDRTGLEFSGSEGFPTNQEDPSKADQHDSDEIAEWLNGRKRIPIPGVKPKIEHRHVSEQKNMVAQTNTSTASPAPAVANGETAKGFVIQLGAFSDQSKAKQQVENLISNGFKAYTETLKTGSADVTRVRIGSFVNRSEAENELKKLKKLGFDGVIASK